MSNQDNTTKYNDITTQGLGYLNRARTVNPDSGKPYESVSLTGLRGQVASPKYTYFDCKSVLGKALSKYLLLKDAINDEQKKVMVRFVVSDLEPDSYSTKDKNTGNEVRRHCIKCRLLDITWASIDDQIVEFQLDEDTDTDGDPEEAQAAAADRKEAGSKAKPVAASLFDDDELDEFVKLDRDDPDFMAKKEELKSMGYRWDSNEKAWFRPAA